MKVFTTILKVLAALAAVVGIVYVVVTYGESIIAWVKTQLAKYGLYTFREEQDASVEELYQMDDVSQEEPAEAAEAEAVAEENTVQAEETDFEG